jgi:hypothetical protein
VERTGATEDPLASELKPQWRTEFDGRLSPITVADGRLFVAQVDAHTVHAIQASSGRRLWSFMTGARVDSPPTIYRGLVLFGSRDGWVYCLRAADGQLVWRFQAAPRTTCAVAFEQLESLWPVHGSVLVKDGVAYAAAGRSSYLDGGIRLVGLDPASGQLLCSTQVASRHTGASEPPSIAEREEMATSFGQNNTDYKTFLAPDRSDAFAMEGALADVLVSDGRSIFLRHLRFDRQLTQQEEKRPHLFATSSLLDGTENHRMYWVLGTGDFHGTKVAFPWIVNQLSVPYGLMLSYDGQRVWGVQRPGRKSQQQGYQAFATPRPDPTNEANFVPDFQQRERHVAEVPQWTAQLPLRPRAMLRAGDSLFYGGMPDTLEAKSGEPSASIGTLHRVSIADGQTLERVELPAPPVWDGLAAAHGRLYIATADGAIVCWGE